MSAIVSMLGGFAASTVVELACMALLGFVVLAFGMATTLVLVPIINSFGGWMSDWMTIPVVNSVILWGQVTSVVIAAAVRVFAGIKTVLMADGSDRPVSLGEYIFKSVAGIALVGLMPVFCSLVMRFGEIMLGDVMGLASTSSLSLSSDEQMLWDFFDGENPFQQIGNALCNGVIVFAGCVMCVKCLYELMKRQGQMLVVSAVAPWVGIAAATETDSQTYWEYLRSLFGMCVIQWAQWLFMIIALEMMTQLLGGDADIYGAAFLNPADPNPEQFRNAVLMLAMFGVALSVPGLLDRWAFSASASNAGTAIVATVIRSAKPTAGGARAAGGAKGGGPR